MTSKGAFGDFHLIPICVKNDHNFLGKGSGCYQLYRPTHCRIGLGLGLAIVRDLVTLQGGSVRAESEGLGKGATFTVLLPIKTVSRGTTSEITSFKEIRIQRDAPANLTGLNVMIVEDDPKSLEVLNETLIHFGAKTFPYSTVREALAAFEKLNPMSW